MCQFPPFDTFHIVSVPFWESTLQFYVSYLQCPIMSKYPIILCFIISLVSRYVQVLHIFTFHSIFSVPFCASSLSIYIPLDLQCPILGKFPIYLHFIISLVSHLGQVPYLFTFHQIFSVPLCASSPYFYISFYIQCPILCKFPNFLCFVISSVSHSGQVPNNFVLHYIFSVPLCASSLSFYLSLFPLCTIMCKFSFFLPSIICSVSHYVQVLHLFTFHYIFSVPFWASSLSIYISLYLQCPIWGKFPIYLHSIRSLVSHLGQVPYLFTFHQIFSVPLCASSPSFYIPLYIQCPILGKYPIILCFIIYLVSHYVQVPYLFTFHYFLCVPLCASSPSFYLPLYVQCPIMCKFSIFLHSIISLVSHFGQVPYLFTFHYIFSVPFGASSLSIYIPLDLQCHIWGKFPIYLHSIRSSVSHYVQVLHLFTFHYIFSVPFWATSLSIYISLDLQCPIMCKFSIFFHFIISLVSHFGQVPYLFTFHQIFSVPFVASSLSIYIPLDLQCPIMGKFPIFLHFIIYFSVPLCASSLSFYHFVILQCPIMGKLIFLHSLDLQCPIMCKFPIFLPFIISFVYHYVQVLLLFTFHYMFSVPFWATSLSIYISLYLQCPILGKYPIALRFIISSVSHYVPVLHIFTFHFVFSVQLCGSSQTSYVSLYIQCPVMCKFPTFLTFHYIFNGLITSKYPIITFNYIFRMSL